MPLVPVVAAFCTLLAGAVSATCIVTLKLAAVEHQLDGISKAISTGWTIEHHRQWVNEAQLANPALRLPNVDEVRQRISKP